MQARATGKTSKVQDLRRDFGERFSHHLRILEANRGILEQKSFRGRSTSDEAAWKQLQANMPDLHDPGPGGSSLEDLNPPATFLASLEGPLESFSGNSSNFFGSGGISNPSGIGRASVVTSKAAIHLAPIAIGVAGEELVRFLVQSLGKRIERPHCAEDFSQGQAPLLLRLPRCSRSSVGM